VACSPGPLAMHVTQLLAGCLPWYRPRGAEGRAWVAAAAADVADAVDYTAAAAAATSAAAAAAGAEAAAGDNTAVDVTAANVAVNGVAAAAAATAAAGAVGHCRDALSAGDDISVRQCRLTVSKPELKAPVVSVISACNCFMMNRHHTLPSNSTCATKHRHCWGRCGGSSASQLIAMMVRTRWRCWPATW